MTEKGKYLMYIVPNTYYRLKMLGISDIYIPTLVTKVKSLLQG